MRSAKILIVSSVSALLAVYAFAPAAAADTHDTLNRVESSSSLRSVRDTEAFNLVSLAYRGELEEQGVPGYTQFVRDVRQRSITADMVVEAAIDDGYLRPAAMEDEDYLSSVSRQLDALTVEN